VRKPPSAQLEPAQLELSDETFIAVGCSVVAAIVADPARWPRWWPDLQLKVLRDRGPKGLQWVVSSRSNPRLTGTAEVYLEPWHDGTVVHLFLRLPRPGHSAGAGRSRAARERTLSWKRTITQLKDELEAGRAPGLPVGAPAD
jgi:hypothetical protein